MLKQVYVAYQQTQVESDVLAFAKKHFLGVELPDLIQVGCQEAITPEKVAQKWQQLLPEYRLPLACHGPLIDLNPISPDLDIRDISQKRYSESLEAAKLLGANYVIFHTQFTPLYYALGNVDAWLNECAAYWQQMIEEHLAEFPNMTILLENFLEDKPQLLRQLSEKVNHPQFRICLDTGHANLASAVPITHWVDELEHHLTYLHVHNNYGQTDDHFALENGSINFDSVMNKLVKHPNQYVVSLEMNKLEDIKTSYELLERYMGQEVQYKSREVSFLI